MHTCGENLVWSVYVMASWALSAGLSLVWCPAWPPSRCLFRFSGRSSCSSLPCLLDHSLLPVSLVMGFTKALFTTLSNYMLSCWAQAVIGLDTMPKSALYHWSPTHAFTHFLPHFENFMPILLFCLLNYHHPLRLFFPNPWCREPTGHHMKDLKGYPKYLGAGRAWTKP